MPVITTGRLKIRPFARNDAEAMFAVWGDPEVMRYIPVDPHPDVEHTAAVLERLIAKPRADGMGMWAVERLSDARVIGTAGVFPVAGKGPEVEVAYHLAREAWGEGYATEAAAACVRYGFEQLNLPKVIGLTFAGNAPSQRVLERMGMRRVGETAAFYGVELVMYELQRASTPRGATLRSE